MEYTMDGMKNKHFRIALYVDYVDSEYVQQINTGAEKYFAKKGIELIVFCVGELEDRDPSHNYQYLAGASLITSNNVDGVLFATGTQLFHATPEYINSYLSFFKPLPVVSIGYPFDGVPTVMPDCTVGMSAVVDHLVQKHHCKKIALMGVVGYSEEAAERTRVFKETLEKNNVPFDESRVMLGSFTYTTAHDAIAKYADKHPALDFDAIVALNDDMAFACIDFLQSKNINVPEDVIVTGFDDLARSAYTMPTLTSINQNIEGQGYTAAEMLYGMLNGKKPALINPVPTRAVFRQSCGCMCQRNYKEQRYSEPDREIELIRKSPNAGVAEWCEKSAQFVQAIHIYSDMQNDMTLDQFRHTIATHLSAVDFTAAAVVFYKTPISTDKFEYFPLPSEALLLSAYDRQSGYELDTLKELVSFDPRKQMLPDGVFPNRDGMIVIALFRSTIQYGYIVFRPGHCDMIVNNMVCKMFANTLASIYTYTCSENEKKALEKEFNIANRISLTDEMTGLLNRRGYVSLAQKTLEVAEAMGQCGMVLYGDMDGLKKINDTYGHAAGDRAIKAEAKLLKTEFRTIDIIGRLGGDEFAIVATGMTEKKFQTVKNHLYANCASWNKASGEQFTLSISLGYALFTPMLKQYNIKLLLEIADKSLYEEKNRKKSLAVAKK